MNRYLDKLGKRNADLRGRGLGFSAEAFDYDDIGVFFGGGDYDGGGSWWDFGGGGGGGEGPYGWGGGGFDPMGPDYFSGGGGGDDDFATGGGGAGPSWEDHFWDGMHLFGGDMDAAAEWADASYAAAAGDDVLRISGSEREGEWQWFYPTDDWLPDLPPGGNLPPWWDVPLTPGISPFPGMEPFDWGEYSIQKLPGACYGPTYHPYPIGHPQQDLCVPYPADPAKRKQAQQQEQKRQQQAQQQAKAKQQQQQCPQGQWPNPKTRRCEPIPPCTTPGTTFDQKTGRCLTPAQIAENAKKEGKSNWWWWLLLAGGAALVLSDNKSSGGYRRR